MLVSRRRLSCFEEWDILNLGLVVFYGWYVMWSDDVKVQMKEYIASAIQLVTDVDVVDNLVVATSVFILYSFEIVHKNFNKNYYTVFMLFEDFGGIFKGQSRKCQRKRPVECPPHTTWVYSPVRERP